MRYVSRDAGGRRRHLDYRPADDVVEAAVVERERIAADDRTIKLSMLSTRAATRLEDVHEVGVEGDLYLEVHVREVEVVEGDLVEEDVVGEQLLAPDVDSVLRHFIRLAQRDLAGGEFDLRRESFFRGG